MAELYETQPSTSLSPTRTRNSAAIRTFEPRYVLPSAPGLVTLSAYARVAIHSLPVSALNATVRDTRLPGPSRSRALLQTLLRICTSFRAFSSSYLHYPRLSTPPPSLSVSCVVMSERPLLEPCISVHLTRYIPALPLHFHCGLPIHSPHPCMYSTRPPSSSHTGLTKRETRAYEGVGRAKGFRYVCSSACTYSLLPARIFPPRRSRG